MSPASACENLVAYTQANGRKIKVTRHCPIVPTWEGHFPNQEHLCPEKCMESMFRRERSTKFSAVQGPAFIKPIHTLHTALQPVRKTQSLQSSSCSPKVRVQLERLEEQRCRLQRKLHLYLVSFYIQHTSLNLLPGKGLTDSHKMNLNKECPGKIPKRWRRQIISKPLGIIPCRCQFISEFPGSQGKEKVWLM